MTWAPKWPKGKATRLVPRVSLPFHLSLEPNVKTTSHLQFYAICSGTASYAASTYSSPIISCFHLKNISTGNVWWITIMYVNVKWLQLCSFPVSHQTSLGQVRLSVTACGVTGTNRVSRASSTERANDEGSLSRTLYPTNLWIVLLGLINLVTRIGIIDGLVRRTNQVVGQWKRQRPVCRLGDDEEICQNAGWQTLTPRVRWLCAKGLVVHPCNTCFTSLYLFNIYIRAKCYAPVSGTG